MLDHVGPNTHVDRWVYTIKVYVQETWGAEHSSMDLSLWTRDWTQA